MAFKYVWRELSPDGRLFDPDEVIDERYGRPGYSNRFNTYTYGYDTESEAVEAYERAIEDLPRLLLPSEGLVLLKIYT